MRGEGKPPVDRRKARMRRRKKGARGKTIRKEKKDGSLHGEPVPFFGMGLSEITGHKKQSRGNSKKETKRNTPEEAPSVMKSS